MSRHLLIASLWLLLGACLTIAVAFACVAHAQLRPSPNIERLTRDELKQLSIAHHTQGSQLIVNIGSRLQSIGYEEMLFMSWARVQDPRVAESLTIADIDAGWPMFAIRRRDRTEVNDSFAFGMVVGAEVASTKSDALLLPVQPALRGIIVNTLFYALVLWLLLAAPFAVRRMLRHRRGLCERCAYPIGVSPVCTECGTTVNTSRRKTTPAGASTSLIAVSSRFGRRTPRAGIDGRMTHMLRARWGIRSARRCRAYRLSVICPAVAVASLALMSSAVRIMELASVTMVAEIVRMVQRFLLRRYGTNTRSSSVTIPPNAAAACGLSRRGRQHYTRSYIFRSLFWEVSKSR